MSTDFRTAEIDCEMVNQIKLELTRLPKKTGGVRYEGQAAGEDLAIYLPQAFLRQVDNGEFPKQLILDVSGK